MDYLSHFNYQILGKPGSKKLVFLHGLLGSGVNWRKVVSHFEDKYEILIFDQRGHGKTFHPDSGYAPEDYAKDLKLILDELSWDKIILIGHSMGGRNAMKFAYMYPYKVEKLVIEDVGPEFTGQTMDWFADLIDKVPTPFNTKKEARNFLMTQLGSEMLGAFLYTNIVQDSHKKFDWRFNVKGVLETVEIGRSINTWDEYKKISCPILIIRGEKSEHLTANTFEQMLKENQFAKGKVILGSGHWVHFEKTNEFVQELKDFFEPS